MDITLSLDRALAGIRVPPPPVASVPPDPEFMAILRLLCIATGFALHIVPLVTMRQVWAAGSTLNFHISTYAFALLNQSVNLWYACIRDDPVLIGHRFFGVVFNAFYVYTFMTYSPPGRQPEFRRTLVRSAVLFAAVAADLHVVLPIMGLGSTAGTTYFAHIAFFGAMTGIGLAAGPLATVGEVLRNKDASSLPLPFLAMVTIQCTAWTVYGYLQEDLSTFANNLVGVVLGLMQLALIWVYPSKRVVTDAAVGKKNEVTSSKNSSPGASSVSPDAGPAAGASGAQGEDDVSEMAPLAR